MTNHFLVTLFGTDVIIWIILARRYSQYACKRNESAKLPIACYTRS
jgi:hypothetical protein